MVQCTSITAFTFSHALGCGYASNSKKNKFSKHLSKLPLYNVFFDVDWEISCSTSTVETVADSSEGTRY